MVMEYIPRGMLFDIAKVKGAQGEEITRFFAKQLISGLKHMQTFNLCHRDLKLENILVDQNFNLKIADFGFACDGT
jgi:serine/threonine protein kinase